jgi:hypothetical protein
MHAANFQQLPDTRHALLSPPSSDDRGGHKFDVGTISRLLGRACRDKHSCWRRSRNTTFFCNNKEARSRGPGFPQYNQEYIKTKNMYSWSYNAMQCNTTHNYDLYKAGGLFKVVHGMVRAYRNIQQWRLVDAHWGILMDRWNSRPIGRMTGQGEGVTLD